MCARTSSACPVCGADGCRCLRESSANPKRSCFPASSRRCWPPSALDGAARRQPRGLPLGRWRTASIAARRFRAVARAARSRLGRRRDAPWAVRLAAARRAGHGRDARRRRVSSSWRSPGCRCSPGYGALQVIERMRVRAFGRSRSPCCWPGSSPTAWAVPIPDRPLQPARTARGSRRRRVVAPTRRRASCLHLPLITAQFQELHYQYATLFHHHPLVNGFTGWDSPLQQMLRHPRAPLYDYARYLRDGDDAAIARRPLRRRPSRRLQRHAAGGRRADRKPSTDCGVRAGASENSVCSTSTRSNWRRFPVVRRERNRSAADPEPRSSASRCRKQADRAAFLVDGDNDSRWIGLQDGSQRDHRPVHQPARRRTRRASAGRTVVDGVSSRAADRRRGRRRARAHTLYRASPYPRVPRRLPARSIVSLDLDRSARATTPWSFACGTSATYDNWWSVHELRLWRRP